MYPNQFFSFFPPCGTLLPLCSHSVLFPYLAISLWRLVLCQCAGIFHFISFFFLNISPTSSSFSFLIPANFCLALILFSFFFFSCVYSLCTGLSFKLDNTAHAFWVLLLFHLLSLFLQLSLFSARQSTVPSTYQCGILLDLIPTPLAKVPFMAGESNRLDPLLAHGTVRGDHKDPTAFLQLARPCQMARSRF